MNVEERQQKRENVLLKTIMSYQLQSPEVQVDLRPMLDRIIERYNTSSRSPEAWNEFQVKYDIQLEENNKMNTQEISPQQRQIDKPLVERVQQFYMLTLEDQQALKPDVSQQLQVHVNQFSDHYKSVDAFLQTYGLRQIE